MNVRHFPLGVINTNCYFVTNNENLLLIDPSGDSDTIIREIEDNNLKLNAVLLTHAHYDHIGALGDIVNKYEVEVFMGEEELEWLKDPNLNLSSKLEGTEYDVLSFDIIAKPLSEGTHTIGDFEFEVLHTPGHSPGSLSYLFKDDGFIISGDVLFNGGVGRTDLHGGNHDTLMRSIHEKLFKLDDKTIVYPGHNDNTTILNEKENNPYV